MQKKKNLHKINKTQELPPFSTIKFVLVKKKLQDLSLPLIASQIQEVTDDTENCDFKCSFISQVNLIADRNWLYYFEPASFKDLYEKLKNGYDFLNCKQAGIRLVRGFEMYGPSFFLLPNKHWAIEKHFETFTLTKRENPDWSIEIQKEFLVKALRKPQECESRISFKVEHYALSVLPSSSIPFDLDKYFSWGEQCQIPAIQKFGPKWRFHINAQLRSKKPYGRVFVPDKITVSNLRNFAYFFPKIITCTKNFYVFRTQNLEMDEFLAAWLNSSIFFFLFLAERREIGGSYGRLQISDYNSIPLFIHMDVNNEYFQVTLQSFRALRRFGDLPIISEQFSMIERQALDNSILSYLGFSQTAINIERNEIYQ